MQDCSRHSGISMKYRISSDHEYHQVLALSGPWVHRSPCAMCTLPMAVSHISVQPELLRQLVDVSV